MVLYEFRCPEDGIVETFAERGATSAPCPVCGRAAARRFSVPVTDCASFGRNMYRARTRPTDRKAPNEVQEALIWDLRKRERTHTTFGAGRTTGS